MKKKKHDEYYRQIARKMARTGGPMTADKWRCCWRKVRYERMERAHVALSKLVAVGKFDANSGYYECRYCGGWHLTRRIGGRTIPLKQEASCAP